MDRNPQDGPKKSIFCPIARVKSAFMPGADEPLLIAVNPRVHATPCGAAQPLDKFVRRLLDSKTTGAILIWGPPGSGKTTALAHLRTTFASEPRLVLLDEPRFEEIPRFRDSLGVIALRDELPADWLVRLQLAPWVEDDWIEYCAARRRERCEWVLSRLRADDGKGLLQGSPQLWRIALDRLAADERLADTSAALREHLSAVLPAGQTRDEVAALCLKASCDPPQLLVRSLLPDELTEYLMCLLRHRAIRVLLAADHLAALLAGGSELRDIGATLPPELLRESARSIRALPAAERQLHAIVSARNRTGTALTTSLMLAAYPFWRPGSAIGWRLNNAALARAQWAGVNLSRTELISADLHDADLAGARLDGCDATGANFHRCKLAGASMQQFRGSEMNVSSADLAGANATDAQFRNANLTRANLRGAIFANADLTEATLGQARLIGANFRSAILERANLEAADLIGVDFRSARMDQVSFTAAANVSGVLFRGASLRRCNLEGIRLPRGDFEAAILCHSYLTGSFMPRANFRGADLAHTGLAEIEWEGADLRDADLRGCTFHMGSTRSGLVGSTIPCEGSKTGFYTDDFDDRDFKSPEEIRKANLCGADLRGAKIEGVDFYLVDLRGARYSREQEEQLERCGAILHSRAT
jgi:uncharacterized protein YjbI with pentapeptide repeats